MKLEREKLIRYVAWGVAVTLTMLSGILYLMMRGEARLELGFAQPRITPTASATPSPTVAHVMVTPAITPKLVQVERNYPAEAVDLVADGRVLFTAADPEAAQEAVMRYLEEGAKADLGPDERLIRAGFDQKLTLQEPSGRGELLGVEEAVNTLKADEGLLPILRTVVRCVIERGDRDSVTRKESRLMAGSRIYRSMGNYPYTLTYYETTYRGQAAFSEIKTNEFAVGQGRMDKVVENGSYRMEAASSEAGPKAVTIPDFAPQWPMAGEITGAFGRTDEGMSYGVELSGESVTRVVAPEEGVVVYCGQRGELGLVIDILHDETGCLSRIIGCDRPLVELYQRVKKGEQVGVLPEPTVGRTVSVRYELLVDGFPVNPEKYLPKR